MKEIASLQHKYRAAPKGFRLQALKRLRAAVVADMGGMKRKGKPVKLGMAL